jgi:hypothetical protein
MCRSYKDWYWQHEYPSLYANVVVTNGNLPVFLDGKVLPITDGVLKAEIQGCPGDSVGNTGLDENRIPVVDPTNGIWGKGRVI